jgi:hypothetical protein
MNDVLFDLRTEVAIWVMCLRARRMAAHGVEASAAPTQRPASCAPCGAGCGPARGVSKSTPKGA